jgi:tetratricopeptide (TPR) repeat protein
LQVAVGREATRLTVPADVPVDRTGVSGPVIASPDGRLLAVPFEDQLVFFDLPARKLVGAIPFDTAMPIRFEADSSALWFNKKAGPLGLYRVRLTRTGDEIRISLPEQVVGGQDWCADQYGMSADGRVMAVPCLDAGLLLFRDLRTEPSSAAVDLAPQHDVRFCTVSPDGKWVIAGSHSEPNEVVLWDVATGTRTKLLEAWGGNSSFSRDSRWACTWRNDLKTGHLWDTTTWEARGEFRGQSAVFSPDARFIAVDVEPGVVRLLRVPDGSEAARLSVPDNARLMPGCFSPDGATLTAFSVGTGYVVAWDLNAIRRQLQPMGLDWDDTPIPAAREPFRYPPSLTTPQPLPEPKTSPSPAGLVVDPMEHLAAWSLVIAQHPMHPAGYTKRAETLITMNRRDDANRDLDTAMRLAPDYSAAYRIRGQLRKSNGDLRGAFEDFERWTIVTPRSIPAHTERLNTALQLGNDRAFLQSGRKLTVLSPNSAGWWHWCSIALLVADEPLRDVEAALKMAEKTLALNPRNSFNHTVRGYALFESGRTEDAAKEFAESRRMKPQEVYDTPNLLGLALCAHRNGDDAQARGWFARAANAGRLPNTLQERLTRRMYAQAAKALGLPPFKE